MNSIDITSFHKGQRAGPELAEPAAGPPDFPAVPDHAHFPTGYAAQHLAHACESPPGSPGRLLPVKLQLNGGSISQAPLYFVEVRGMSWLIVGTKAA